MLFFLTGDIQIGKTRWLLRMLDELEQRGVEPCGVVAPGIWVPREGGVGAGEGAAGADGAVGTAGAFEKLGIDNLLLPQRRIVPFARRRDLAQADGAFDENSQAARADLQWAIHDDAIVQVNAHFDELARIQEPGKRLLVVDEFGRLELLRGEGLTSAMALIDQGATPVFPHALVIVRAQLLDVARERFAAAAWGGMEAIGPDDDSAQRLLECVG